MPNNEQLKHLAKVFSVIAAALAGPVWADLIGLANIAVPDIASLVFLGGAIVFEFAAIGVLYLVN